MFKLFKFGPREQGFTLVEVMVVAGVLLTVLIPSIIMFYEGIRYVGASKLRNQAIAVAEEKMERIRNLSYNSIPTNEPNPLEDSRTIGGKTFSRNVDVVASPSEISKSNADIKKVTVTVTWTDSIGSKSVRLITYRTKQL